MTFIEILITLLRWKQQGWEVHPIDLSPEFSGWI
jgi:hypothetical protein